MIKSLDELQNLSIAERILKGIARTGIRGKQVLDRITGTGLVPTEAQLGELLKEK